MSNRRSCFSRATFTATAPPLRPANSPPRAQVERLGAFRARRDPGPWKAALDALGERARTGGNLMPSIIEAAMHGATVGEIAGRLREVFGEHRETLVL